MTIYSEVKNALYSGTIKILQSAGFQDVQVVFSHQNGAEPVSPYCVIQIVNIRQVGRIDEAARTDVTIDNIKNKWFTAHYEIIVQFSFLGSTAPDMAHEFLHAVNNNRVMLEEYQKYKLSPIRKTTLRRIPQKRDTQWIEWFNTDVTFSYAVQTKQPVDWVETVTVSNEAVDPPDSYSIPPQ